MSAAMPQGAKSATSTHPTRGSRVGECSGSLHGGRRHVHARAHLRSTSGCSGESLETPAIGTPSALFAAEFPRGTNSTSTVEDSPRTEEAKALSAYQEQPPVSVASKPAKLRVQDGAATASPSSVTPEAAAAAAKMLLNPEAQRRMVAAGTSNPLHVWGQEMAFFKSHFFSPQRHRSSGAVKRQGDESAGATEMPKGPTRAGDDLWPPRSAEAPDGQSVAEAAATASEGTLHTFGGEAPFSSRACRGADESDDDPHGKPQCGKGAPGSGAGGGKGERLLPTPYASEPVMQPGGAKTDTWASLAVLRMRNMNALRAYSWDQRVFLPQSEGLAGAVFELLASPRIWEKVDWAVRGSAIAILPTLIVCLEPTTSHIFPMPTSVVFLAYWTTQPTFGAGLRDTFTVLKAFIISLALLCIVVATQPSPKWLAILILFFSLSVGTFAAQQLRVMIAYCFASLMMQYIAHPEATGYKYIGDFYLTLFIGQGFAVGALVFPYIRWSSENARRYLIVMGDAISLSLHGACCSLWVEGSLLERQLNIVRLRQLRQTIEASTEKAQKGLSEMGYEPHSGVYITQVQTRMTFLKNVFNIVQSMTLVIEQVAANPTLIETPMCRAFGERIRGELGVAAAAMDAMLLRIVNLDDLVSAADMVAFRAAKARYEDAVSSVRDEVILSNEDYRTDNSDILLGFFLFSVEELMEFISGFQDAAQSRNNLWYFLTFPLRDLQSLWSAFVELHSAVTRRHSITRRLKEGIKLSFSVALAAFFQTYVLNNSSTNPIIGVETIAFLYRSTGGDSFKYGQGRLLGTVLGCLTGLVGVHLANGSRPVLYVCTLVLTFIGSYVQSSPDYGPIGTGMSTGVISVVLQYTNKDGAIVRIQQNCFAVIIYFIVTSLMWPVRCQTKVRTGFDGSMRMGREVTDRLLRNLDLPHSAKAVSSDTMALLEEMQKKVEQQLQNLSGARWEPTMDSAEFPEMAWRMLVSAQRKLVVTLLMMRHAYTTFMSSTIAEEPAGSPGKNGGAAAASTNISVHWVVLHRISPYTRQLSLLLYEAMEVYLLLMSRVTFVPTLELTRLRLGMMQCYDRIVAVYIEAIQHELRYSDGDDFDDDDDDNTTGTAAKQSGAVRQAAAATAGAPIPVFTPSGLIVDAEAQENNSFLESTTAARSHSDLRARRPRRKLSQSTNSQQQKKSGSRGGRISYKLTLAERQRLRDYVLGEHTAGNLNASFFASAVSMSAGREADGVSAALRNMDPGANFANNSMFNMNGTFFDRNASMFDPVLLRNAGIVVHEPVHEEPMREQGEGSTSDGLSTHPAMRRSSCRPDLHSLHSSNVEAGGTVVIDVPSTVTAAVTPPVIPVGFNRSLMGERPLGAAVSALPSLRHSFSSAVSPDHDGQGQQQRHQLSRSALLPSLPSAPPVAAAPATSKARKVARRPSVLQHYIVGPTSAAVVARSPSVLRAAANAQSVGDSGPLGSNAGGEAADQPAPSHGALLSNNSMFMGTVTGDSRVTSGDVFALGRAARATLRPGLGLMGAPRGADRHHDAGDSASHDAATSELSVAHTAVPARDSEGSCSQHEGGTATEASPHRARKVTLSPPTGITTVMLRDDGAASTATVPRGEGVQGERNTALVSSLKCLFSGAPGKAAATDNGGSAETAEGHVRAEERRGTLLSDTGDGEDDWEGGRETLGTALSGRSNHLGSAAATRAYYTPFSQLSATLPIPTPAAAGGDATTDERAAGGGTSPLPSNLDINGSFNGVGPVVPAALRAYVEGLAAHQQQQAPLPPALLGNTSYINLSNNLPVISQRPLSGLGGTTADSEDSVRAGAAVSPLPVAARSALSRGGARATSISVVAGVAPLPAAAGTSSPEDLCLRSFGLSNNTEGIVNLLRSFGGTQSFSPALLRLLRPDGEAGSEGTEDEYVLTNSDIHSLEAFLFGMRALITHVEEIERYLLEVVHGMEMAKKL
ncbi:Fusaric_acid_resistance_protein-like (plasmid) [Leishmania braziliensis MHOM/BR/75/M2904]|uniref:Fusaric_acid_resistance_protein-like n=1 Tax=Leishmania braziliensis MHOM/BR/75/M2904 TaxID=420245 RepID=A0A3P3Z0I8_LEIBR|nr:Fusaric_acid_resistance_protein-like [Leishmania braziliensis MHOM/BR/75/M2904]